MPAGLWPCGLALSCCLADIPDKRYRSVTQAPFHDDDELLVRASAVLKSKGPENWSRGRPGPGAVPAPAHSPLRLLREEQEASFVLVASW